MTRLSFKSITTSATSTPASTVELTSLLTKQDKPAILAELYDLDAAMLYEFSSKKELYEVTGSKPKTDTVLKDVNILSMVVIQQGRYHWFESRSRPHHYYYCLPTRSVSPSHAVEQPATVKIESGGLSEVQKAIALYNFNIVVDAFTTVGFM